jgi:hypothetical protein
MSDQAQDAEFVEQLRIKYRAEALRACEGKSTLLKT